ncbi:hypothetical protein EG68_04368 [Paragonimus skrjabini miyazakii]|uniref:Glycosyl transferase 64 domain-containing protein n=1 Tax=Paragonimus skrjabini miyazakii TaxID=59628 RepID=A0A8S9Z3T8_9TREM|nr:hypothetical protein EG68_04368 [Paragonimus skrjabini miyazakii]
MLYYDRWDVLLDSLKALQNVANLHTVIIVWNHPIGPSPQAIFPKVFKAHNNSLNNRFLPLDLIQTEAILSLDDDVTLTVSEIEKGFSVWKENRERLVGYPERDFEFRSSSKDWAYKVNSRSKSYSMILTGAAFFHKVCTTVLRSFSACFTDPNRDVCAPVA